MYASNFAVSRQQSYTRSTALASDIPTEPDIGSSGPEQYATSYYYGQPTGFAGSGSACTSSVAYAATAHDSPCIPTLEPGLHDWSAQLSQPFAASYGAAYATSVPYAFNTAPTPAYVQPQASSYAPDLQLQYPYDDFHANPSAYAGQHWESQAQLPPPMSSMADLPAASNSRHSTATAYHEDAAPYKGTVAVAMASSSQRRPAIASPLPRPAYRPLPHPAPHSRVHTPSDMAIQYSRKPAALPVLSKSKPVSTLKRKAHDAERVIVPPTPAPRERKHACTMCYKRYTRTSSLPLIPADVVSGSTAPAL